MLLARPFLPQRGVVGEGGGGELIPGRDPSPQWSFNKRVGIYAHVSYTVMPGKRDTGRKCAQYIFLVLLVARQHVKESLSIECRRICVPSVGEGSWK